MKNNSQSGYIIPLVIALVAVLVAGGAYLAYKHEKGQGEEAAQMASQVAAQSDHASTTSIGTSNATSSIPTSSRVSVSGMSQYTDSNFGFSFWYPNTWTVMQETVTSPDNNGWFQGGTIMKELNVHGNQPQSGVTIQEFHSSSLSITELGQTKSASPVGVDQTYFFSPSVHTWMYENLSETPSGNRAAGTITATDVSNNTMGGLHIFSGAKRFGADSIIPLSASNFLVVSTNDGSGYSDQKYLVNTITATDPSVATPVNQEQQTQTIQAESSAYIGQKGVTTSTSQPSITVLSPNGGESYQPGNTVNIAWTVNSNASNVALSVDDTTGNLANEGLIDVSAPNTGSYSWTIPQNFPVGSYKIHITSSGKEDSSDNYFTIVSLPSIITSQTYTNSQYGFSIGYPSTWNVQMGTWNGAGNNEITLKKTNLTPGSAGDFEVSINIGAASQPAASASASNVTVADVTATKTDFAAGTQSGPYTQYSLTKNGTNYLIEEIYNNPRDHIGDQILSTFHFTNN